MKHYLLVIEDDVSPRIKGPYDTAADRDGAARAHVNTDPDRNDGVYRLDLIEVIATRNHPMDMVEAPFINAHPTIATYTSEYFAPTHNNKQPIG